MTEPGPIKQKPKRLSRKQVMKKLGDIQHLIGRAKGEFLNDRDPMRSDKLQKTLDEAFNLALNTRD